TFRLDGSFQSLVSGAMGKCASLIIEWFSWAPLHSYFQSGSSGCFRSQSGRRLRTVGIVAKLYSAGGELVAHSRVHASHGSLPAGWPFLAERMMLIASNRTAVA